MTYSPERHALGVETVEQAAVVIRDAGHRFSAARRVILEALCRAEGAVSADFIAGGLGGELTRSDLSSVYRNLELLEKLGVVRHLHVGHGPSLYELYGRSPREYMVCGRCNAVRSVEKEELDPVREEIRSRFGYEARFDHFPIIGLCRRCAAAKSEGKDSASHGHAHDEHEHLHSHGDRIHSHPHEHGRDGEHVHGH